jgi:ATP-dependent RNA helicase RhlE
MPNYNRRGPSGSSFGGPGRKFSNNNRRPQKRRGGGEYINPEKFIQAAKPVVEEEIFVPKNQFADFDVADIIKSNLAKAGFVTPSPIQDQAIPFGIDGHDIVGIANTGTGKTAAFAVPVLHNLMRFSDAFAIIVAPTRELAQQIEEQCKMIGKGSGVMGALLIGGMPMGPQLRQLRNNPQIVIGTPGRIKDHVERGSLNLSGFNMIVLDEVDRMLDMGFLPDVNFILQKLAPERQSYFFSATMDPRVKTLITKYAPKHVTISLKKQATSESVNQDVVHYSHASEKADKLHDILNAEATEKVIVFDETQRSVERLSQMLQERGFKAEAIHGGKTQGQRKRALDQFKKNHVNILVATDVAARGIDVSDITHVINYSVPQTYDDYVHRIGRAGRAGRTGYALTFVPKN